jgi:hypothetical protein
MYFATGRGVEWSLKGRRGDDKKSYTGKKK